MILITCVATTSYPCIKFQNACFTPGALLRSRLERCRLFLNLDTPVSYRTFSFNLFVCVCSVCFQAVRIYRVIWRLPFESFVKPFQRHLKYYLMWVLNCYYFYYYFEETLDHFQLFKAESGQVKSWKWSSVENNAWKQMKHRNMWWELGKPVRSCKMSFSELLKIS